MKIKLDENLPVGLITDLTQLGHDVDTVSQEGLQGREDSDVWSAAQEAERFLITQDLDFSDSRTFAPGAHHGILLVRLREPSRRELIARIRQLFTTEETESWAGCFVVATRSKVRIRRPQA